MTLRESITEAIIAALAGISGCPAERSRVVAVSRGQTPVLVVRPEEETVEVFSDDEVRRELTLALELFVRGPVPDQIADPFLQAAHAKIMADRTLGGACDWIVEADSKWELDDADQASAVVTTHFRVLYTTSSTDLTRAT